MTDLKKLTLAIAIIAVSSGLGVSIPAFAVQVDEEFLHTHATALTDPNLVCGNHKCAIGETSHAPSPVVPVRGHR